MRLILKRTLSLTALCFAAQLAPTQLAPTQLAHAQTAPQPPPDPRFVAAQRVFEALPDVERRAIQIDLTFATTFTGAASGTFGSLTFAALQRFERENNLEVDAVLTSDERKRLAAKADEARKAIRFDVLSDERTGVRIGLPLALLPRASATPQGASRWQSADGKATLDTLSHRAGGDSLQQYFDRAIAPTPGRTVTYKFVRADMFVVTGETASGKFYRRMSLGSDGALRGFTLAYDKALAPQFDRMSVAVANTFEPFPAGAVPARAATTAPVVPPAVTAPVAVATPALERLMTGVAITPDMLITSAAALRDCRGLAAVSARRLPARVMHVDDASGLALVSVAGLNASPAPVGGSLAGGLTSLSASWSGRQPVLVFADLTMENSTVSGALQVGGAGAGVFDAAGALVAIVTDDPTKRRQIAGIVPAASYKYAGAPVISGFVGTHRINMPAVSTVAASDVAARRASVIALACAN